MFTFFHPEEGRNIGERDVLIELARVQLAAGQPQQALDMGNSGTSTRLLMGLVASHGITATFTGDASLSKRPMGRVIEPLSTMGANFTPSPGGTLPLFFDLLFHLAPQPGYPTASGVGEPLDLRHHVGVLVSHVRCFANIVF